MKATFTFALVILMALIVFAGCTSPYMPVATKNCKATIEKVYSSLDTNKMCFETETKTVFCAYNDMYDKGAFNMLSKLKPNGESYILMLQDEVDQSTNTTRVAVIKIYTMQTAQNTLELKDITNSCG
jgi:hypothetical protein